MKRLIIAVDCDDVLVGSMELLIPEYNKRHGTSISLETSHSHSLELWKADDKQTVIDRLTDIQMTYQAQALPGAYDVLRSLAETHELHMVTARPIEAELMTLKLVQQEFDGLFTSIEHVGHQGSKGEVCARIQADALIDDNLRHVEDALGYGVAVAIWFGNYPWQSQEAPSGVVRCNDWKSVGAYFERAKF